MEDLERLVAGRLRALDDAAPSPAATDRLLSRVGHQVRVRRRRRRIAQSAAGASLVVAAAVVTPLVLDLGETSRTGPSTLAASEGAEPSSPAATPDPGMPATPRPGAAGGLTRDLPSGKILNAFGVTSDGAVLGTGVGPRGRSDGVLWRADLSGLLTVPTPLAEPSGLYAVSGGRDLTVWAERKGGAYQLMCQEGDAEPVRLGEGGVARRGSAGFHADADMAVWTDKAGGIVWTVHGCADTPTPLANGYAAGFSYPYAYVLETDDKGRPTGGLQRVQVETGAKETRTLPGKQLSRDTLYAAGAGTFSASDGTSLTVYDAATWQAHEVPEPLPKGDDVSLSAGDGVVVYSARNKGSYRSLIYETETGQTHVRNGEAYAKGEWLLTRDDDETYQLNRSP